MAAARCGMRAFRSDDETAVADVHRLDADPHEWRRGWATRFVEFAKDQSPDGLELHTHQRNHAARTLYEKHGFTTLRFGISPPPESAPDVEYHWRRLHAAG